MVVDRARRARVEDDAAGTVAQPARSKALSTANPIGPLTPERILALQRTIGNGAVGWYLQRKRAEPSTGDSDLDLWKQREPEYESAKKKGQGYLASLEHRRANPRTATHETTKFEQDKKAAIERVREHFTHSIDEGPLDEGALDGEWFYYVHSNSPDDQENFYENEILFPSGKITATSNHNGKNPNPPANSDVLWFQYHYALDAHRSGTTDLDDSADEAISQSDDDGITKEELAGRAGIDIDSTGDEHDKATTNDPDTESPVVGEPRPEVVGTPMPMITRSSIVNEETQHIAWMVLDKGMTQKVVAPTTDDGYALLGSPNGKSAVWILHDHPEELGDRNIAGIMVEEKTKLTATQSKTKLLMHIRYQ